MRSRSRPASIALLTALAAIAGVAGQTAAARADATVAMDVFTSATVFAPGQPLTVAVALTTDPAWHIYWKNAGDSGLPTRIKIKAPDGFIVGPVQYPLPERFALPGGVTAFGYSGTATFLVDLTPPATWKGNAPVTVSASWLCCQEECVMGNAAKTLVLASPADAAKNDHAIKKAEAALPTTAAPDFKYQVKATAPAGTREITFTIAHDNSASKPIAQMDIFPDLAKGWLVSATAATDATGNNRVTHFTLNLQPTQPSAPDSSRAPIIPVLITTEYKDGSRTGVTIQLSPSPTRATDQTAKE